MPALASTYLNPTGKNNLLASINKWLQANIGPANSDDFTYFFTSQINPTVFPCVSVTEFPYFDPGFSSMGNVLFPSAPYTSDQGRKNHAMLDINIYDSVAKSPEAKRNIYRIRDRMIHGLTHAGFSDDITNAEILPPICVLDYDNGAADTGIMARVTVEDANHAIERYYAPTSDVPDVHRYQILIKFEWYEMQ